MAHDILPFVPSHRRPHLVETNPVVAEFGDDVLWVVNDMQDYHDYRAAGAGNVVVSGGILRENFNIAMEIASTDERWLFRVDDDIGVVYKVMREGTLTGEAPTVTFREAAEEIVRYTALLGAGIGGCTGLTSPNLYKGKVRTWAFCTGQMMVVAPYFESRVTLTVLEDWELTLESLRNHGCVAHMQHYVLKLIRPGVDKTGGYSEFRTRGHERITATALSERYADIVELSPPQRRRERKVSANILRLKQDAVPPEAREAQHRVNSVFRAENAEAL